MSTTSSSFSPLQFTGISQYSSDFQQILSRAVSIAQIPVMQLTNEQTQIVSEETTLGNLNSAVSNVGSALKTIGQLSSGESLAANSTDTSVVTATATGADTTASYSITNVTSLASAASEHSTTNYTDTTSEAVSTTGSMQLVYGSKTYNITLAAGQNNVAGLRDAINNLGAGVTASILTPSSTGAYLSISANTPGETTLKLIDDPSGAATNILTGTNQGTNTNFDLNGIPVSSPGTTVNNVIPGITLSFQGTTSSNETVNVNLATDRSQISSALNTLVSSYNTLKTQMDAQFGTSGSVLSGNNILYQIRQAMSNIVQYQGGGTMGNLANLGIEMSETGQMSLNTTTFNGLSDSDISSAMSLLGTSTTGIGGLQQTFNAISDPITGSVATQTAQWNTSTQNIAAQITAKNAAITLLQATINQQLQAADASIADLESQQNTLTASLTSLSYVSYGYNTSTNTSNTI
jgi:flagellar hook-associated protein 2